MTLNRLLVTLVRHGESQDNQQGIWAGFRDTPLTANGISQARALGQSFANVPLTAIYCSDLKRAAMTADEIFKYNRSIPPPILVQSKTLREISFGEAEGQSYASSEWMAGSTGEDARDFRFPGGESLQDVNTRIARAVRQFILPRVETLRNKPSTDNVVHICIVAHGIAIAELLRFFMSLHVDSPSSPWPDPKATYHRVRLENTGWSRLELAVPAQGEEGHLSDSNDAAANASAARAAGEVSAVGTRTNPTDFGEVQADLVEGPSDALKKDLPPIPSEGAARSIFVRILCQNQIDHLRGFNLQTSSASSAAKAVAHLAGGGAAKTSSANSPAPGSTTSSAAVGLPPSATLASIASNATSSNSHTTSTLAPSTPAAGASLSANGNSKSSSTAPASARSLLSYDSRMMARELERAGAASMLAGSEAGQAGVGASSHPSSSSVATLAGDRSGSTAGLGAGSSSTNTGSLDRSPAVGSTLNTSGTQSGSSTAFGTYSQAAPSSLAGATSPNPATLTFPVGPGSSSDTWQMICIRVLPLFNGEALRTSIEELNEMVSLHVRKTLERSQAHAIKSLTLDLMSLTATGTLTLNAKLQGLDDAKLLLRLVEVWTFFLGQVLPYCEGCFLPFQTDSTLRSFIAASSTSSGGSGGAGPFGGSANVTASVAASILAGAANGMDLQRIDVRKILLLVFRDQVLMPIYERLFYLFAHLSELDPAFLAVHDASSSAAAGGHDGIKQVSLRLLQMISVLASILSEDEAQEAMNNLLRALRLGTKSTAAGRSRGPGEGQARATSPTQRINRRGWMAQKARKHANSDANRAQAGVYGSNSAMGEAATTLAGTDGFGLNGQRAFLARPALLLGGRYGADMTEDEYLTSLRSPAGSPAVSTPGNQDEFTSGAVEQTDRSVVVVDDESVGQQGQEDGEEDRSALTPVASQTTNMAFSHTNQDAEQMVAAPG